MYRAFNKKIRTQQLRVEPAPEAHRPPITFIANTLTAVVDVVEVCRGFDALLDVKYVERLLARTNARPRQATGYI